MTDPAERPAHNRGELPKHPLAREDDQHAVARSRVDPTTLASFAALKPKHQRFITEYVVDFDASKAAQRLGSAKKYAWQTAKRILADEGVRLVLAELQAEAARQAGVSLEGHVMELARLRDAAKAEKQYAAAIRAEELRGRTAGYYVDRHEEVPAARVSDEDLAKQAARIIGADPEKALERLAKGMKH